MKRESSKSIFNRLYASAKAEVAQAGLSYQGTPFIDDIFTFALDNADDTCGHNSRHPQYWIVALGSVQCSAEAYGMFETVQSFCKKHGYAL